LGTKLLANEQYNLSLPTNTTNSNRKSYYTLDERFALSCSDVGVIYQAMVLDTEDIYNMQQ